jgi:hypothetical protein
MNKRTIKPDYTDFICPDQTTPDGSEIGTYRPSKENSPQLPESYAQFMLNKCRMNITKFESGDSLDHWFIKCRVCHNQYVCSDQGLQPDLSYCPKCNNRYNFKHIGLWEPLANLIIMRNNVTDSDKFEVESVDIDTDAHTDPKSYITDLVGKLVEPVIRTESCPL